jgi:hypothetical protein
MDEVLNENRYCSNLIELVPLRLQRYTNWALYSLKCLLLSVYKDKPTDGMKGRRCEASNQLTWLPTNSQFVNIVYAPSPKVAAA